MLKRKLINFKSQKIRFLIVGGWNTFFSYAMSLICYNLLENKINLIIILILINVLAILMSFTTQRLFVFKSSNMWYAEFIKNLYVYGLNSFFGLLLIWLMVIKIHIEFWIAQTLVTFFSSIAIFYIHKNFTFKEGKR